MGLCNAIAMPSFETLRFGLMGFIGAGMNQPSFGTLEFETDPQFPCQPEDTIWVSNVPRGGGLASPGTATTVACRGAIGRLAGSDGGISKLSACHFGSIFFGIVEVLSIVPIPGCKILTLDCDSSRPCCSSA